MPNVCLNHKVKQHLKLVLVMSGLKPVMIFCT